MNQIQNNFTGMILSRSSFKVFCQDCSNYSDPLINMAFRGRSLFSLYVHCKIFKNILVQKYWPILKIIWHKCSLVNLFQDSSNNSDSVEKHGHQGVELVFMPPESPIRWASSVWPVCLFVCLSKKKLTLTTTFEL